MKADDRIAVGIVGAGAPGAAFAREISAHPKLLLTAICDTRESALAAYRDAPNIALCSTIDELAAYPGVEAVVVATPTPLHCEHTLRLLRAGKHVLVEKPLAASAAEGKMIADTARQTERVVVVGHSHSYEAPIRAMRALIDSGVVGPLRCVNALNYTDWMYRPRHPDELDSTKGGSVIFRQAAHHADILRYLAGGKNPSSIRAETASWDSGRMGEGSYSALVRFGEDFTACLFYSGYDHFPASELTFGQGEAGRAGSAPYGSSRRRIEAITSAVEVRHKYGKPEESRRGELLVKPMGPTTFGLVIASCEGADLRVGPEGLLVYSTDGRREIPLDGIATGRRAVLDELIGGIAGLPVTHDANWGTRNLELCAGIRESGIRHEEIHFPATSDPFPPSNDRALIEQVRLAYENALGL